MQIVIIICVSIIMYARMIKYGAVIDDTSAIDRAKKTQDYSWFRKLWSEFMCHNIYSVKRCHSWSLLIHTVNCILIYYVFGQNNVSFLAALLFCVNPANNQGAAWMSGRGYSMVCMWALVMYMFRNCIFLTPVIYFFSIAWGFAMVTVPSFYIVTDLWWMILVMIGVYLLRELIFREIKTRIEVKGKSTTDTMRKAGFFKLILVVKFFWYYLFYALWPMRPGMYHNFGYSWGVSKEDNKEWLRLDKYFWYGIVTIIIYAAIMLLNIKNPMGFGMFWFAINISPWLHFITLQQAIGERYLYLPNAGLMLALSYFILNVEKLICFGAG